MFRKTLVLAAFAMFLLASTANADVVKNGGFETGDFFNWTLSWTTNPSDGFAYVVPGVVSPNEAVLGTVAGQVGTVSQTLSTTAGEKYFVSFDLANDDFDRANSFAALWNGSPVLLAASNSGTFGYTKFGFNALAQGSDSLSFVFSNNAAVFHLDNVMTPEPGAIWLLGSGLFGLLGIGRKLF